MFNKIITIISISALLILTGCAMIEKTNATDTEQVLAAAGFTMKLADTPEKLDNIAAMTQRKVVAHSKNGTVQYANQMQNSANVSIWDQSKTISNIKRLRLRKILRG